MDREKDKLIVSYELGGAQEESPGDDFEAPGVLSTREKRGVDKRVACVFNTFNNKDATERRALRLYRT